LGSQASLASNINLGFPARYAGLTAPANPYRDCGPRAHMPRRRPRPARDREKLPARQGPAHRLLGLTRMAL